jgi:hypothetical protein
MPEIQASRRLVKSPPELWAEVSDAASLARHLGEVGEITITRLEPETTVAWEGERASGTVELAPAGWGTSVTLTAEPTGAVEEPPAPEPGPAAAVEPEPEPVEPEPAPVTEPEPIAMTPESTEPKRRSWFARLLRRRAPEPAHADRAGGVGEAALAAPPAKALHRSTGPARSSAEPEHEEPAKPEPEPDPLADALTQALDSLGQAHHRPFSRG